MDSSFYYKESSDGYTKESSDFYNICECCICLDELDNGSSTRQLQCGHMYHTACIDEWLKKFFTCPYCRECENNIDCYWLWLKPYGLSFVNKHFKYKLVFKEKYIEIIRNNYINKIKLTSIKQIRHYNNTITFVFGKGKNICLWFKDSNGPFSLLQKKFTNNRNTNNQNANNQNANNQNANNQNLNLEDYQYRNL